MNHQVIKKKIFVKIVYLFLVFNYSMLELWSFVICCTILLTKKLNIISGLTAVYSYFLFSCNFSFTLRSITSNSSSTSLLSWDIVDALCGVGKSSGYVEWIVSIAKEMRKTKMIFQQISALTLIVHHIPAIKPHPIRLLYYILRID